MNKRISVILLWKKIQYFHSSMWLTFLAILETGVWLSDGRFRFIGTCGNSSNSSWRYLYATKWALISIILTSGVWFDLMRWDAYLVFLILRPLRLKSALLSAFDSAFESVFESAFVSAFESAFVSAFESIFASAFGSAFGSGFASVLFTGFGSTLAAGVEFVSGSFATASDMIVSLFSCNK